jgi:thiamine-monophosphate kinase
LDEASRASDTPIARVGRVEAEPGLRVVDAHGQTVAPCWQAFDHFAPG